MNNYTKFPEFNDYNKLNQEELSEEALSLQYLQKKALANEKTFFKSIQTFKSFEEISNEIAMSTPLGENSIFHSKFQEQQEREEYLERLLSLMNKHCIDEFYYINSPKDSSSSHVIIHLKKEGGKLQAKFIEIKPEENKKTTSKNIENNLNRSISISNTMRNHYFYVSSNQNWIHSNNEGVYTLPFDQAYYLNKIEQKDVLVSPQELRQIYEDFIASESNMPECFNVDNYEDLVNKVRDQLDKEFYKNVNVAVNLKLVDTDGNTVNDKDKTLQTNDNKPYDVKLNISIKPDATVEIKHIASENYMKQYVSELQKEAEARGLEVDVETLRMQSVLAFESQETEKSFYQKLIQEAESLFNDNVAGYVEGIQVSQKIVANIWEEGTINESTWFTKAPEHKQWPKYAQINSLLGGAIDGVVDEIVGIPVAVKGVYEIITDDEKQVALKNIFTKEGAKQMFEGLISNAKETLNDEDKRQHFAGQTVVSVATMLSGAGFLTKAGKLDDAAELGADLSKVTSNSKTIQAIETIKSENKYLPNDKSEIPEFLENREFTKEFFKKTEPEILDDIGEDLSKIIGKGEDFTVLKKARNLPGVSTGKGKEIKGKWLKGTEGNAGLFPKSVAEKLKGKEFKNFDEFRREFWKTVAEDNELSKQFSKSNIAKMKNGNAPTPVPEQWIGKQMTYVLHHKTPIYRGGGVYDMDNLYIVTPKFHKEILNPAYHYGYEYK